MPFPEITDPKRQLQVNGRPAAIRVRHVKLSDELPVEAVRKLMEEALKTKKTA